MIALSLSLLYLTLAPVRKSLAVLSELETFEQILSHWLVARREIIPLLNCRKSHDLTFRKSSLWCSIIAANVAPSTARWKYTFSSKLRVSSLLLPLLMSLSEYSFITTSMEEKIHGNHHCHQYHHHYCHHSNHHHHSLITTHTLTIACIASTEH